MARTIQTARPSEGYRRRKWSEKAAFQTSFTWLCMFKFRKSSMGAFAELPRDMVQFIARHIYNSVEDDTLWTLAWQKKRDADAKAEWTGKLASLSRNKRLNSKRIKQVKDRLQDLRKWNVANWLHLKDRFFFCVYKNDASLLHKHWNEG